MVVVVWVLGRGTDRGAFSEARLPAGRGDLAAKVASAWRAGTGSPPVHATAQVPLAPRRGSWAAAQGASDGWYLSVVHRTSGEGQHSCPGVWQSFFGLVLQ